MLILYILYIIYYIQLIYYVYIYKIVFKRIQAYLSLTTILLLKFFLAFRGENCNAGS